MHMPRPFIALALLGIILGMMVVPPHEVAADPNWQDGQQQQHVVQPGENLFRIARRYNTTVSAIVQANPSITNPNIIYVGQTLIIPGSVVPTPTTTPVSLTPVTTTPAVTVTVTPTPTAPPTVYIVRAGDNLYRIARQFNTTVQALVALNPNIANPNVIFVGQQIRLAAQPAAAAETTPQAELAATTPAPVTTEETPVEAQPIATGTPEVTPAEAQPVATDTPTATAEVVPESATTQPPPANEALAVDFSYGVNVQLFLADAAEGLAVVSRAQELGVAWVRQEVEWRFIEPVEGQYNFAELDAAVNDLSGAGFNILLTVSAAPDWARNTQQEKGPAVDNQKFANFVAVLAEQYRGRVQAYEIWKQPNLRREWRTEPGSISGANYVALLREAYNAIKRVDPTIVVVTAGLSPTGFNDGINAIDDRVFLRQMYQAGVGEFSDAIGINPYGFANPPDSTCCNTDPELEWDNARSFFFLDTLRDYRAIMEEFGDAGTFMWVTEFGWGSLDGLITLDQLRAPDVSIYGFLEFIDLDEQAQHTVRAFQIAESEGYIGPMFLWNLNYCQAFDITSVECMWSLLNPAGDPRPAFNALRDVVKE